MNWGKDILLAFIFLLIATFCLISLMGINPKPPVEFKLDSEKPSNPWIIETIPDGGSIFSVLANLNLPLKEVGLLAFNFGDYIDVSTIQPGDTLKILLSEDKQHIAKMMFVQEPITRHHFTVSGDSLIYNLEALPVTKIKRILEGRLEDTLDASLLAMGFAPQDKQIINNSLETEINFARDARNGDFFRVFVEECIFEGKTLPGRKIFYVQYSGKRTGTCELFRYEDAEENSVLNGLYTKEGKSCHSNGVGFPLSVIHLVSPFGKRIDPFYGTWAYHQGVDYRARYGTPVYAVANGKVTKAGYNSGFGNEICLKHPSGLLTQYAHLSSMSVRKGQSVKKGQIIGRVGATGRATGAHLHFGLIKGKKYINPANLKMVGTEKLNTTQMERFKTQQQTLLKNMENLQHPQAVAASTKK
ncbi:MAG TPA: M23 family metallopeptidase [Candidatus Cloacimonas sp.]|jgi:murein DD-endopeptidase MepM/ murein hydrolase activator NlpD|nr:M23 family metallopeptidase [Candidatus Cloacimonas sp.]HNQ40056.1 M23 family metallopeptidase [Candidatus Cloacimonas sp.]HPA24842.1 M23 family metallopeptidase [Candidatus Cloacimonas sp.]HPH94063.1 M23 family metallopeptidase [Candidatus Cloacimonas sp.]HPX09717.1 M23 family metallopeptidase [Candidatus Cloacimonas sp.]